MKANHVIVAMVVLMAGCPALAQPQTSVDVTRAPGSATVVGTAKVTATIVAIEPDSRTVTLKDGKGRVVQVEVGEEARNFDQLKVGDIVTTEYREAISLSLSKTSGPRSAKQRFTESRSACSPPFFLPFPTSTEAHSSSAGCARNAKQPR